MNQEKTLLMNNLLLFIGCNLIIAILFIWGITYVDKYLRVIFLLKITPWENVKGFDPPKRLAYKGVYIWQKKGLFFWHTVYVGQSVNIWARYKQHISNKGSHEIYLDYKKNPSKLRFKAIALSSTHYSNLDALVKRLIMKYKTDVNGYNKTSGNGSSRY